MCARMCDCVCVCVSMRVDRDFSDAAKLVENDTAFFFFFETN